MLSQPHGNMHERHRQHRRQISTPSALEAAKVPSLPAQAMHRYNAHRRGQSFDQRSLHAQRAQTMQDGSIPTNATVPQQSQHMVRPGHSTFPQPSAPLTAMPECQPSLNYGQPMEHRPMHLNLNLLQQQHQLQQSKIPFHNSVGGQILESNAWNVYPQENIAAVLPQQPNTVPGDMRRPSLQSDLGASQRPHTPPKSNTHYLPITPATTPFKKSADLAQYGGDIQPTPTKEQSFSVSGSTYAQQKTEMPSPPNTASFDVESFDVFDQQGSSFDIPKSESSSHSHYDPSSGTSSFMSSPELAAMPCPGDGEKSQKVPIFPVTPTCTTPQKAPSVASSTCSSSKAKLSPKVASIDNLNLDDRVHASIKQTGVTIDEIASFIHGPDHVDGKWVCLHPGCGRRFGRKENIKSHVQTHLGDRQYKCDHCNKCFVRGHDLKRHAKIHTGDKPYECLCGNVFARHDALTRHRQRGMCIGGYKGIVRKTTKRGRPKKHRPEMDDRQEKSSRTRQRIAEMSFDSSASDVSHSSPPADVFDTMSPAQEMPMFSNPNYSLPPEVFTFTPPASPGCSIGNKPSPNQVHRSLTPNTEDEMLPLSPSKPPLEKIPEEPGLPRLPYISDGDLCPYTDVATSTTHALSSPHTAPTLSDSNGSDLDIFINQDATSSFKSDFPVLGSDIAEFPDYVGGAGLDSGMELFQGKSFAGSSMGDDFFFQFQADEPPSDVMTREFFMD